MISGNPTVGASDKSPREELLHVFKAARCEDDCAGSPLGEQVMGEVSVTLEDVELWRNFKKCENEMIVTKNGRRMFPTIKVRVKGLEPGCMYSLVLDFIAADRKRWKYVNGRWEPCNEKQPSSTPPAAYLHPDSPNFGSHWMSECVTFNKVKLSNKDSSANKILLHSLHKYQPRIHVVKLNHPGAPLATFEFSDTQFIAVTAYQNDSVTTLKIKHNPFAKAFQDTKDRQDGSGLQGYRSGRNTQQGGMGGNNSSEFNLDPNNPFMQPIPYYGHWHNTLAMAGSPGCPPGSYTPITCTSHPLYPQVQRHLTTSSTGGPMVIPRLQSHRMSPYSTTERAKLTYNNVSPVDSLDSKNISGSLSPLHTSSPPPSSSVSCSPPNQRQPDLTNHTLTNSGYFNLWNTAVHSDPSFGYGDPSCIQGHDLHHLQTPIDLTWADARNQSKSSLQ